MGIYALIEDGKVRQLQEIPDEYDIYYFMPESMEWVNVTGMDPLPAENWGYDGTNFTPYVPPPPPYVDPRPALYAQLDNIDKASARPLRELIITSPDIGVGTDARALLDDLEAQAQAIRDQIANLPPPPSGT